MSSLYHYNNFIEVTDRVVPFEDLGDGKPGIDMTDFCTVGCS